ncbi:MAG TPA: cysteine desulfurase CsdA [Betaproteobacteria bacterium]|jgi:cysteine desulfurase/selenocysteine lyase|nr:cysteine desulfurase CsdA [Betaproteobacteria bacterium]HAU82666.1 cysteine desulfurase CsdA [Betaproteobacteria bacterium]
MGKIDREVVTVDLDAESIKKDFPILSNSENNKSLVYLDSGASAQMPQLVIDRINHYHQHEHANIHRGVYDLSEQATISYESVRSTVARFLNVADTSEVIFTKGTTHAINLVAHAFGRTFVRAGDEIVISHMEHHSNIVPWQQLCEEVGATLKIIPISDIGELDMEAYGRLLSERTKIVAVTHVSNVLGTINPIKEMVALAHSKDIPVLVDGAQGAPHMKVDIQDLDCDFYIFSGHKVCGPTGIGILYGKRNWLERMNPYEGGGDMILSVTFEKTTYAEIPAKFEAGTPPIASAIGLGEAIKYLEAIGLERIEKHEKVLTRYATEALTEINGLTVYGTAPNKAGVISFGVKGVHPHDMGTLLSDDGVAVRAGHHCAQPVMQRFKVPATTRASFYLYNTLEDIDRLVSSVRNAKKIFS